MYFILIHVKMKLFSSAGKSTAWIPKGCGFETPSRKNFSFIYLHVLKFKMSLRMHILIFIFFFDKKY